VKILNNPAIKKFLAESGDDNKSRAYAAQEQLAQALELPLREAILSGDNLVSMGIFEAMPLEPEASPEFPLDLINPGDEDDFVAYTHTGHGKIPQRQVESDYVTIATFMIANSIDWLRKHARNRRIDLVGRAMQLFRYGFTKKMNDLGWQTIIAAGVDRNILVYDADATAGMFTKRLISLGKTTMRRNGGGNASSLRRGKLTDVAMSPEGIEDIRNWNIDQIDEISRREIFLAADNSLTRIFGVNLHDMDEFGVDQEYQLYFENTLGASVETSDVELAIGLDLSNRDSFIMPIKQEVSVYADDTLHRWGKAGFYGEAELGFGVLDSRRVIALSY